MDLCGWWDSSPSKYPEMVMCLRNFSSDKWPSPINDYFMGISPCVRHTVWCAGQRWRTWACGPLGFGCSFHLISAYAGFQKISQHMSTCDMALVRVLPDGSTVVSGMKPWCLGIEATLLPHSATILVHCPFNCGHSAVYPFAAIQSASNFPWSNWHMMTWGGSRYLVPRPPKMRTRLTYLHFFPHLDHSKSTRRSQMYTWESHFSKHIGARRPRITYLSIATFGGVGNEQCSDQNQPPGVPAVHLRGKTYTPNSRSSRKRYSYGISNGLCKQR